MEAPIKGLLLAGVKADNAISNGVVFLSDDGVLYVSDTAVIDADGKTITFKGKPLIVNGDTRTYANGDEQWFKIGAGGEFATSKGTWRVEGDAE